MSPAQLIERYPLLFHMAEDGSWPSIRTNGLLSTSNLLDLYHIAGNDRTTIECRHRAESIVIKRHGLPDAVVRDQKPMSDASLEKCLQDGITPHEWYAILNRMCFFWVTEERLVRLLKAKPYRSRAHTVLTLDTALVVGTYLDFVRLSPLNSGCSMPWRHMRGADTFSPVEQYPFEDLNLKRRGKDPIVEFAVLGGVAHVEDHAVQVRRMRESEVLEELWHR